MCRGRANKHGVYINGKKAANSTGEPTQAKKLCLRQMA